MVVKYSKQFKSKNMRRDVLKKRDRNQILQTKLNAAPANLDAFNDFVSDGRYKIHPLYFVYICVSTKDFDVAKAAFEKILKNLKPDLNPERTMKLIVEKCNFGEITKMAAEKIEVVV